MCTKEQIKRAMDEYGNVVLRLASLPMKYREVIHLFYYEGYQTKEIAHLLKKRESTVRSLLARAREMLKNKLKGECDFA